MVEKRTFEGDSPINARIKIDYSKNQPKVSFSYPDKKRQLKGSMYLPILVFWVVAVILLYFSINFYTDISKPIPLYNSLYNFTDCINSNSNTSLSFTQNYDNLSDKICSIPKVNSVWGIDILIFSVSSLLIIFAFLQGITFLTTLIFKKRLNKLYPRWQAFWSDKKYAEFSVEDVKYDKELGYYCELPVFANIILDYKAKGDFSKYLHLFEIKEYKFYTQAYRRFYKGVKKKSMINEFIWYARFYFKQKPKKGNLEVIFK